MLIRLEVSKFLFEIGYSFGEVIGTGFEQTPIMLSRMLIPDFQSSAMRDDSSPNVFACQTFSHLPGFVEHHNCAIRCDLAKEVNTSSRDWQRIWQVSQLSDAQAIVPFAALCLLGHLFCQDRRCIVCHIPVDEGHTRTTHTPELSKPLSFPKSVRPQAVQLFYLAIAFAFRDTQKDQFYAQIQTQPNKLPEDAPRLVAATKRRIVVEL